MGENNLTIIYTYYGQKERLKGIEEEYHPDTRVIIVDDCSPEPLECPRNADCYRIDTDITWNQPGAKNLGFQEAEGWIVCADIDHLVTKENVEDILKLEKKRGHIYYLGREDNDSWNVFLIHKEDFPYYDEDFSGHYGYDDLLIYKHFQKTLKIEEVRNIRVKVFAKESSSKLERNIDFNRELFEKKLASGEMPKDIIRFKWRKL